MPVTTRPHFTPDTEATHLSPYNPVLPTWDPWGAVVEADLTGRHYVHACHGTGKYLYISYTQNADANLVLLLLNCFRVSGFNGQYT